MEGLLSNSQTFFNRLEKWSFLKIRPIEGLFSRVGTPNPFNLSKEKWKK